MKPIKTNGPHAAPQTSDPVADTGFASHATAFNAQQARRFMGATDLGVNNADVMAYVAQLDLNQQRNQVVKAGHDDMNDHA